MKAADMIAREAVRRAFPDATDGLPDAATGNIFGVHRVYYPRSAADEDSIQVPTQILDEGQMMSACKRFIHLYRYKSVVAARPDRQSIRSMYDGLMWICAIESVASSIYAAAIGHGSDGEIYRGTTTWGWQRAHLMALSYAPWFGETKKGKDWQQGTWPAVTPLRTNSRRISNWATTTAIPNVGSEDAGYEIATSACDAIRHYLIDMAKRGADAPLPTRPANP